jgi:hypothetical protein
LENIFVLSVLKSIQLKATSIKTNYNFNIDGKDYTLVVCFETGELRLTSKQEQIIKCKLEMCINNVFVKNGTIFRGYSNNSGNWEWADLLPKMDYGDITDKTKTLTKGLPTDKICCIVSMSVIKEFDYHCNVVANFQNLYREEYFCDFTFTANLVNDTNEQIKVKKLVIASHSEKLKDLMKSSTGDALMFEEDCKIVKYVVKFMYFEDTVCISENNSIKFVLNCITFYKKYEVKFGKIFFVKLLQEKYS